MPGAGLEPQAAFAAADFKSPPTVVTCRTPRIYRRLQRTNRTKRTLRSHMPGVELVAVV